MTGLSNLYLEHNSLTQLPAWIAELSGLMTLWLHGN